jgi:drug/metabolite transporter (DMT)-like permease
LNGQLIETNSVSPNGQFAAHIRAKHPSVQPHGNDFRKNLFASLQKRCLVLSRIIFSYPYLPKLTDPRSDVKYMSCVRICANHMTLTGYLYAVGAAVTWGLVYTIDQRILRGASPFALLFIDSLVTALLLLPVLLFDKGILASLSGTTIKTWLLIIASLILAALANFLIFSSIKTIGASYASIFEIAYPFFVVLFSYFVFSVLPSLYFMLGAVLILCGSAIIVFFSK